MSGKVLVIPEDPQNNGYILRPFVQRILEEANYPARDVAILSDPRPTGFDAALRIIKSGALAERWGRFAQLWLFIPDADRAEPAAMNDLERSLADQRITLLCCPAIPELEAWLLAGSDHQWNEPWRVMRESLQFKEHYAEPFLAEFGNASAPGGGRGDLAVRALRNWSRIVSRCREIEHLVERLRSLSAR